LKKVSEIALFDLFYRPAGVSLDFHSPLQNSREISACARSENVVPFWMAS
jgi:hypothetical protein